MKSTLQVIAFNLAIAAGVLAARTAPVATVFAFAAAVFILAPSFTRKKGKSE